MLTDNNVRLTRVEGSVRNPAMAGHFYPSDPAELEQMVRSLLRDTQVEHRAPKAIIAPHAGYIYSGITAARAYAVLAEVSATIKRVVLLGPAHRVALQGMAVSAHDRFATPIGSIPIDKQSIQRLLALPQVTTLEAAHEKEHSLEVHLPFLQLSLQDFTLIPLVVGHTPPEQVREVLELLWGGPETLIVISSDLSHFHDYDTARRLDKDTSRAIRDKQFEKIGPQQACGCMPLRGLLSMARDNDFTVKVLQTINSGDTAGSRDRVVGYGAYLVYENFAYTPEQQQYLLSLAWQSIASGFDDSLKPMIDLSALDATLTPVRATFVTLKKNGKLRGCIGTTHASEPLAKSVINSAYKAAFSDPRFPSLQQDELAELTLQVSVLTPPEEMNFSDDEHLLQQLQPGKHGLIIQTQTRNATFLPSVWEQIPQAEVFLSQLKKKANIKPQENIESAWTYESVSFTSAGYPGTS